MTEFVFGFHPVREALRRRPGDVERVLLAARRGKRRQEIEELCSRGGVRLAESSPAELSRLVSGVHNGFVAELAAADARSLDGPGEPAPDAGGHPDVAAGPVPADAAPSAARRPDVAAGAVPADAAPSDARRPGVAAGAVPADAAPSDARRPDVAAGPVPAEPAPADPDLVVLLEDIQDPRNLGALLRVCEGAGVGRVLLRDRGSAPVSPTVVKASAGASVHVALERIPNSANALGELKDEGFWVYGADEGGESVWDVELTGKVVLCFGGEEKGLRARTRKLCDRRLALPMKGRVESLNVATAAAAILYEALRQRRS